jgi:hypothetical protein
MGRQRYYAVPVPFVGHFKPFVSLHLPASQREASDIAALWKKSAARNETKTMRGDAPFQTIGGLVQITGTDATLGMFEQIPPASESCT